MQSTPIECIAHIRFPKIRRLRENSKINTIKYSQHTSSRLQVHLSWRVITMMKRVLIREPS